MWQVVVKLRRAVASGSRSSRLWMVEVRKEAVQRSWAMLQRTTKLKGSRSAKCCTSMRPLQKKKYLDLRRGADSDWLLP